MISLKLNSKRTLNMLVLERKEGQWLYLYPAENVDPNMSVREFFSGHHISIQLKEITGTAAKVAIDAPKSIVIVRDELTKNNY
jgi:sRNA-binding carbon storage regulator CsrA